MMRLRFQGVVGFLAILSALQVSGCEVFGGPFFGDVDAAGGTAKDTWGESDADLSPGTGAVEDYGRAQGVRLIYFVPSDRAPAQGYMERANVLAFLIQDTMARSLRAYGLGQTGPQFVMQAGGGVEVELVRGEASALFYVGGSDQTDGAVLHANVQRELAARKIVAPDDLVVVLADVCLESARLSCLRGGVALGGATSARGGLGMFSGNILRTDVTAETYAGLLARFQDATPVSGEMALYGDGTPTYEVIDDELGAVIHELGHGMGAPHDFSDGDVYVMGNGFRNLHQNYVGPDAHNVPVRFSYANSVLVAFNAFVNPSNDWDDVTPPVPDIAVFQESAQLRVSGWVMDDRAVGGVNVAVLHPASGAFSVVGGQVLEGAQAQFNVLVRALGPGENQVQVIAIDRGGNRSGVVEGRVCMDCENTPNGPTDLASLGFDAGAAPPYALRCPQGMVIRGFDVAADHLVRAVSVRCADAGGGQETVLGPAGQSALSVRSVMCPVGTVAVGIHGHAVAWVDALGVWCAPLSGWRDGTARATAQDSIGGNSNPQDPLCPRGSALTQISGAADDIVRTVVGRCEDF